MHNLYHNFTRFSATIKKYFKDKINSEGNFKFYPNKPKMSDVDIIALAACSESLSIDSENLLFSKLKSDYASDFTNLICRASFNRRKRHLNGLISEVFQLLSDELVAQTNHESINTYIIDSTPVPICKPARRKRCKICKDDKDNLPNLGYSAFLKDGYFGYKLHTIITKEGIAHDFMLSKASAHDIHGLKGLVSEEIVSSIILADKGYLSEKYQASLFEEFEIKLLVPKRVNMKEGYIPTKKDRRSRKRIETYFSQLSDQFNLKRNYAKSYLGLATRIKTKIIAVLILQAINIQENKPINHLQHALKS